MTAVRRLQLMLMSLFAATALFAQTTTTATTPGRQTDPVVAETDQDANNPQALRLSLDEAIRTSLANNLGIRLESYDFRMTGENLRGSYGIFDPLATGTVRQSSEQSPSISSFQAESTQQTIANFGFTGTLPTGANYDVRFNNNRTDVGGGVQFVNPSFGSGLDFAVTQPLLRDFGIDVTRRGITIARNNLGISREAFRLAVMDTAVSVEQAYLQLIYARRAVDVVKESLFLARDQARITQIRIDVGASAPLDILQPRVTIATGEEQLILAVANVRDAEDRLRQLLNLPPAEWDRPILPTGDVTYTPSDISMDAAVARAFELRPELRQLDLTTDNLRVQRLFARNQMLPVVDLAVGYGSAGTAGRVFRVDPNTGRPTTEVLRETGYFDTLDQVFGNDFPSWNIGVNLAVPIFNIAARAEARRAELDLERSEVSEEQLRQNIRVEVRDAARAVVTAARSIQATRAAREAAEQNLEAERRRYENGMTTNFQVLEIQQQLSDARVRELQALVFYNQNLAAYHRAVGDILEVRNITVDEPEVPAEPRMFSFLDRYNWLNYGSRLKPEERINDDNDANRP
ncbi:MAG TPA: TolC family protein [Thermoanaerobaculia bacterium]